MRTPRFSALLSACLVLLGTGLTASTAFAGPISATAGTLPVTVAPPASAPPDNCVGGYWPSVVQGRPSGFDAGDHGTYLWHDPDGGWALRVTHAGPHDRVVFSGTLQTGGRFVDVRRVLDERNDIVAVSPNGHTIFFRFINFGWVDGLDFATHCSGGFTVSIDVNGRHSSPDGIHLGLNKATPTSNPFRIERVPKPPVTTTTSTTTSTTNPGPTTTTTSPGQGRALRQLKQKATRDINERVGALRASIAQVLRDKFLGSDGATLTAGMNADITGLLQLRSTIQADTTLSQAQADYASIFTSYRVYYLVLPVSSLVRSTDYIVNVSIPGLNNFVAAVQPLINASNQSVLQPLLSDIQTQVSAATKATSGLSAQLLGYTPADYNANSHLLDPARSAVETANIAIGHADQDASAIEKYLRRHRPGRPVPAAPTTTTSTTATSTTTTA